MDEIDLRPMYRGLDRLARAFCICQLAKDCEVLVEGKKAADEGSPPLLVSALSKTLQKTPADYVNAHLTFKSSFLELQSEIHNCLRRLSEQISKLSENLTPHSRAQLTGVARLIQEAAEQTMSNRPFPTATESGSIRDFKELVFIQESDLQGALDLASRVERIPNLCEEIGAIRALSQKSVNHNFNRLGTALYRYQTAVSFGISNDLWDTSDL